MTRYLPLKLVLINCTVVFVVLVAYDTGQAFWLDRSLYWSRSMLHTIDFVLAAITGGLAATFVATLRLTERAAAWTRSRFGE